MKRYVIVPVLLIAFTAPAIAGEFYIAQDPTTKDCDIVEEKPDGQTKIMIGKGPYSSAQEARAAKKDATECAKKKDATE
jgi:hypothetical protein